MFPSFNPSELRDDYLRYQTADKRLEIESSCFSKVVRWKWARGQMFRPEPSFEWWRPMWYGHWLNPWSVRLSTDVRHGMDAEGRFHAAEQRTWIGNEWVKYQITKICLIYTDDRLDVVTYRDPEYTSVEVFHRFEFDRGKLKRCLTMGSNYCSESRYVWKDIKPSEVYEIGCSHEFNSDSDSEKDSLPEITSRTWTQISYDGRGRLEEVLKFYVDESGKPIADFYCQLFPRPLSHCFLEFIGHWL